MTQPRADALAAKLEKGRQKTFEILNPMTAEQWQMPLYHEPTWQVRHLLAHFGSAERQLLALAQAVAGGGPGAPPDLTSIALMPMSKAGWKANRCQSCLTCWIKPAKGPLNGSGRLMPTSWIRSDDIRYWGM